MLWWALAILGLTVLVLYAMMVRRHIVFLGVGAVLTVLGGLGIAGVLGGPQENPLEAIGRGLQGVNLTQPAPPASPSPTPDTGSNTTPDTGSSLTPPASPSPVPSNPGSSSGTTEPAPPASTPEPTTPPAAPEQPSPAPAPTKPAPPPAATEPPPAAVGCPCALEVSTNASAAAITLQLESGQTIASSASPARFDNLAAGTYTVTVEATGTRGYTGTVTLPQTRTLGVYLER